MSKRFLYWIPSLILALGVWGCFAKPADALTLTQSAYRFYVNEDSQEPTDPWPPGQTDLAENTAITSNDSPPGIGDVVRIRMNVGVTDGTLSQAEFKLQVGQGTVCSSIANKGWKDIGGQQAFTGYDNNTPSDGEALNNTLLSSSNIAETYEEANSAYTANEAQDGEYLEWDWSVQNIAALDGTHYCFRMVKVEEGAQPLNAYDDYPQLDTESPSTFLVKSQNWQWFGDEGNETPTSNLSILGTRPIGIRNLDVIKLRMTLAEVNGVEALNQKYRLQFDTTNEFLNAGYVADIFQCDSQSIWCYADGVDEDDDAITTLVLPDSNLAGRHNETAYGNGSTFTHSANGAAEMEFTLAANGAEAGTDYYFRVLDPNNQTIIETNTFQSYPSARTREPALSFSLEGVEADMQIDNYTTNIASTPIGLDFGDIDINVTYLTAQRLHVTEDGLGYQVLVYSNGSLISPGGFQITDFDGTNAVPLAWSTYSPGPSYPSAFGYHAGDDLLSDASTRFLDDDTWAGLSETPGEIVFTSGAVEDDIHDILYRLEVSSFQAAQPYTTEIYYVVVGTY